MTPGIRDPKFIAVVLTTFEWNALGELVTETRAADVSRALASGQLSIRSEAFAYVTRVFHDANGRVVRVQIENRDGNTPELGQYVESAFSYDILDHVVSEIKEVDATHTVTTEFRYTPNEHLEVVVKPEGNQVAAQYDERNLVFQVTRGFGSTGAAPSTVTYNYNDDGKVAEILDPEHLQSDGQAARTRVAYDGFERATTISDALGGQVVLSYDPTSRVVRRQFFGHPANNPAAPNVLLAESRFSRDELGRVYQLDVPLFLAQGFALKRPFVPHEGLLTPGDGLVTTRFEFDAISRRTFFVEDDGQTWRWIYDGAGRVVQTLDPLGNARTVDYDQNSHPTSVTSTEVSAEGLVPNETFTTLYVWDSLDRLVRLTDNAGRTATLSYDSRGLVTETSDANGPLIQDPLGLYTKSEINASGNTCHFFHDGLGRLTKKVCDLRVGGQGGNALDTSNPACPNGVITTSYLWDGNSRLAAVFDDKGSATRYQFDELDRAIREVAADETFRTTTYSRDDEPLTSTDANATVVTREFDNLKRLTAVHVTPNAVWRVEGTVSQHFSYDGASRLTKACDTTEDGKTSEVSFSYDSLSRVLEETQDGLAVSSQWAGDGRRLALTYASGTKLTFDHDANKRLKDIVEGTSNVAHWDWIGPGTRPLRRAVENGVTLSFLDDAGQVDIGWDAVRRLTRMRYVKTERDTRTYDTTALVDLGYTYDRSNNRTSETRYHEGDFDSFTYDSAYRLVGARYAQALPVPYAHGERPNGDEREPQGVLGLTAEAFAFDGLNNRTRVTTSLLEPGRHYREQNRSEDRGHGQRDDDRNSAGRDARDPAPPLSQSVVTSYTTNAVNEYLTVGDLRHLYDASGNLRDDGSFTYTYDFRNLLVSVTEKASQHAAYYRYDALGRRVAKTFRHFLGDHQQFETCSEHGRRGCPLWHGRRFVFDGGRVIEEQEDQGHAFSREWVYGVGVDEPLRMIVRATGHGSSRGARFYYAQNAIGDVVALTDDHARVVERYRYLAFGREEIIDVEGKSVRSSECGNPFRFQARWRDFDEGSPLTYFRARYYDPQTGRFTTRDPATGTGYLAFSNRPMDRVDPAGLQDFAPDSAGGPGSTDPLLPFSPSDSLWTPGDIFSSFTVPMQWNPFSSDQLSQASGFSTRNPMDMSPVDTAILAGSYGPPPISTPTLSLAGEVLDWATLPFRFGLGIPVDFVTGIVNGLTNYEFTTTQWDLSWYTQEQMGARLRQIEEQQTALRREMEEWGYYAGTLHRQYASRVSELAGNYPDGTRRITLQQAMATNPAGGRTGPDEWIIPGLIPTPPIPDWLWPGNHSVDHDARGFLYTYFGAGEGYGAFGIAGASSNPLLGQIGGAAYELGAWLPQLCSRAF